MPHQPAPPPSVRSTRLALSVIFASLLAITALVSVARSDFGIVVEKVLTALAMPYGICWLLSLLLCAANYGRGTWRFAGSCALCLGLYASGNGWLAKCMTHRLEREFYEIRPLEEDVKYDEVIVLGGGTSVRPGRIPELGSSGDRVYLAAALFHAGKTNRVICTGRRIEALDRSGEDPSRMSMQLLEQIGVPAHRISRIGGRTTMEEMRELQQRRPKGTLGLITSAWHMRRALRLANSVGLEVHPLPADFLTPVDRTPHLLDFVPSSFAAEIIRLAAKENLARWIGR